MEVIAVILLIIIVVLIIGMRNDIAEIKSDISDVQSRLDDYCTNDDSVEENSVNATPPVIPPIPKVGRSEMPQPVTPRYIVPEEETPAMPPLLPVEPQQVKRRNIERLVGENLFSKIGILVLIIGVCFFVKYAIDRDWINEVARTSLGMVAGFGLWGVAYKLRDNYRNFSSILAGGGFAICFASVGIGYNYYSLFGSVVAMGLLVLLTAVLVLIALRFDRMELAITAVIGAFVAPFIAGGDSGNLFFLLGYMGLLDIAMFAVTMRKNWWILPPITCAFTYIVTFTAMSSTTVKESPDVVMLFILLYMMLFSLPLVTVLRRNHDNSALMTVLTGAMGFNDFAYITFGAYLSDKIGWLQHLQCAAPMIGALLNGAVFLRYYRAGDDKLIQNILIGSVAAFVTIAIFMQFSDPNVMISCFAVYAVLLLWLFCFTSRAVYLAASLLIAVPLGALMIIVGLFGGESIFGDYIVTGASYLISGAAFCAAAMIVRHYMPVMTVITCGSARMVFIAALWSGTVLLLFGSGFIYYECFIYMIYRGLGLLTVSLAMLVVSMTFRPKEYGGFLMPALVVFAMGVGCHTDSGSPLWTYIPQYAAMAVLATVIVINGIDAFRKKIMTTEHYRGYVIYFNVAVLLFALLMTTTILSSVNLDRLYSACISITLALAGAVQMAVGMRHHSRLLRIIALCTLGAVILKLGVYDLWRMAAVGRIVVFILLGVILLVVSFFYQRLRGALIDRDDEGQ